MYSNLKIAVLLILLPSLLCAQSNKTILFDNYLKAAVTARAFNGTALIAQHGKIVYKKAFGYADYTSRSLLTDSSVFELASITKPIVAYAIVSLASKGKLSLDDSLRKFIPELPYSGVRIRHMLTHVSGVPDAYRVMDEKWDKKKIATNADEIDFMIREKLPADFQPGTQTAYSNTAYELLAVIIERITHMPFDKWMESEVFAPNHLRHTSVYPRRIAKNPVPDYALGYVKDSLGAYVLPDSLEEYAWAIYPDGMVGAGGIAADAGDLFRFYNALHTGMLIPGPELKLLMQPQSFDTSQAIGWNMFSEKVGRNEFGNYIHMGIAGWAGYRNDMIFYPADGLMIIVLSNNESDVGGISGALAHIMHNQPVVNPMVNTRVPLDTGVLQKYTGNYVVETVPRKLFLQVYLQQGRLYCRTNSGKLPTPAQDGWELIPASASRFYAGGERDLQVLFETGKGLQAGWFVFSGMKKRMMRIK